MALVRVRAGGLEFNVGAAHAVANELEVIPESTRNPDGSLRPVTRVGGRKRKPKTTVSVEAAKKAGSPVESDSEEN